MAKSPARGQRARDAAPRKFKKKTSPLVIEKVEYVDYKDVDLLSRFMSDRGKIRGQRINATTFSSSARWQTPSRSHAKWGCCRMPVELRRLPVDVHRVTAAARAMTTTQSRLMTPMRPKSMRRKTMR